MKDSRKKLLSQVVGTTGFEKITLRGKATTDESRESQLQELDRRVLNWAAVLGMFRQPKPAPKQKGVKPGPNAQKLAQEFMNSV